VAELILTDLAIVESRGERVEREHKARRKGEADWEWDLIRRLRTHLGAEGWARELAYNDEEMRMLRGYGLLTMRPALVVFNCGEDDLKGGRCAAAESWANQMGLPYEVISAELELELSELSETDRADFLAEYGLASLARERIIGKTYELVQAVTFFTVNENEARAWTVPHGTTARTAAGKIHTDMEKGFVRAEVVAFADYESAGGMSQARQSGKVRLEGQDYVVQDGDIVQIRFTR
jgi:ribosome-binding ATPase YchF (GTP1/OBG family)